MIVVRSIIISFVLLLMTYSSPDTKDRIFINSSFRPDKSSKISKVRINFSDSIPDDTLTIYYTTASYPEAVSRNIRTAVCIDSLCRLVDIRLFWEITGKFLGYSLPSGEELTKREHTPFTETDYKKLTEILCDSSSQLGFYSPSEIHPVKQSVTKTDGITGATAPDLASWIVPEAAYTSFTIWHLTYGATRDSIMAYSKNHLLSNQLLINLLQTSNPYNQMKALHWIGVSRRNDNQFIEYALAILHSSNYLLSRHALKFLKRTSIDKERLQKEVIALLGTEDFRIKNLAIEYIRESEKLTQPVAMDLMAHLTSDNYYLVNVILSLLEKRYNPDSSDQFMLCSLLNSKNGNVSERVYYFLLNLPVQSPDLAKQLNRYRRINKL